MAHVLARHDLVGSMGQVASAGDDAAMESFFSLLQKNVLDRRRRADPRGAAPGDHHLDRTHLPPPTRQARLGRLTPIEYETIMTTQVALAA